MQAEHIKKNRQRKGNNSMVGATVACTVAVEETQKVYNLMTFEVSALGDFLFGSLVFVALLLLAVKAILFRIKTQENTPIFILVS